MIALVLLVLMYILILLLYMKLKIKDLIMGYAKILQIETYFYVRARQTVVSNYGRQPFHVLRVHIHMYMYAIGESKDVSDRPPSTPGGGFLSYLNGPVCACRP